MAILLYFNIVAISHPDASTLERATRISSLITVFVTVAFVFSPFYVVYFKQKREARDAQTMNDGIDIELEDGDSNGGDTSCSLEGETGEVPAEREAKST
ncbi:hypothetical protein X943_001635 [Babesia divergens]|uniref:Uncharacterized protein n=1 Tax=Babesia divergens TaxID=32595 RepID=A0AAD9GFB1_BABDI|nr:hypothetical protein X943_001635 [Babesia divergens]